MDVDIQPGLKQPFDSAAGMLLRKADTQRIGKENRISIGPKDLHVLDELCPPRKLPRPVGGAFDVAHIILHQR